MKKTLSLSLSKKKKNCRKSRHHGNPAVSRCRFMASPYHSNCLMEASKPLTTNPPASLFWGSPSGVRQFWALGIGNVEGTEMGASSPSIARSCIAMRTPPNGPPEYDTIIEGLPMKMRGEKWSKKLDSAGGMEWFCVLLQRQ